MQHHHIDVYTHRKNTLNINFSPQRNNSVEYDDGDSDLIPNQFVLIAQVPRPSRYLFIDFDHERILSSDDI